MMAQFSGGIDNSKEVQPLSEKTRSLGAIEEVIILAGSYASLALPQVILAYLFEEYLMLTRVDTRMPTIGA